MDRDLLGELDAEARWNRSAFRWVFGLGAGVGAWCALFGLLALQSARDGAWPLAGALAAAALLPNLARLFLRDDRRGFALYDAIEGLFLGGGARQPVPGRHPQPR